MQDCGSSDLPAFTACIAQPASSQRMCVYNDLLFVHNVPYQVTRTDPGLMCIWIDNSKISSIIASLVSNMSDNGRNYYDVPATPTTDAQFATLASTSTDIVAVTQESQTVCTTFTLI